MLNFICYLILENLTMLRNKEAVGKHFSKVYPYIYHQLLFFSLAQVKCGTSTIRQSRIRGVVVKALSAKSRCQVRVALRYFYSFSSEPCFRGRVRGVMQARDSKSKCKKIGYPLQLCCRKEKRRDASTSHCC